MKRFLIILAFTIATVLNIAAQEARPDSLMTQKPSERAESRGRHAHIEDPMFPTRHRPRYDDEWDAHEGVNVRVSASATVGLGSGSPSGVGIGRSLDILYVSPIKNKLGYTLGASTSGMDWGGLRFNEVGLHGSMSYFPSDKLTLTLTGYKSLLANGNNTMPYPCGYYGSPYVGGPFCGGPFFGGPSFWGGGTMPYMGGMGWPFGYGYYGYPAGHLDSYVGGDINWKLGRNSWLEVHIGTGSWR